MKSAGILAVVFGVFAGVCLISWFVQKTPDQPASPISGAAQMKNTVYGCQSTATLHRIFQLLIEKDEEAADNLIRANFATGECIELNAGQTVYVEDFKLLGLRKVRPQGNDVAYWTVTEAVAQATDQKAAQATAPGSDSEQPSAINANGPSHIGTLNIGCTSRDTYDRAIKMINGPQTDHSAQVIQDLLDSGRCIELDPGTVVKVVEDDEAKGRIKVMPDGETTAYWTMRVVVDP